MIQFFTKLFWIGLILLILVVLWRLPILLNAIGGATPRFVPSAPTLEQIQALSVLTTLRVEVADVCEVTIEGKTGAVTAALIVRGTATLGIDLKKAKLTIDAGNRRAVLELPNPTVQTVALDHERTRVAALQATGLWIIVPGGSGADTAVFEQCYRRGEQLVGDAARSAELTERARHQTQSLMNEFFMTMGMGVDVRWQQRQ